MKPTCARCAEPMTKAEGGNVFTICEACWTTDVLADVALHVERDAALAALKVAREALEEFERDESESIKFVAARALARISELVPS